MCGCIIDDCRRPAFRRGHCYAHYERLRKYGSATAGKPLFEIRGAAIAWLHEHKGFKGSECLKWPFLVRANGYGSVRINGRHRTANSVMCELAHGLPPISNMDAAHSFGNGHLGCVNPNHLRWATRRENVHDAMRHGTTSKGEKHSAALKAAFSLIPRSIRREAKRLGVSATDLRKEGEMQ